MGFSVLYDVIYFISLSTRKLAILTWITILIILSVIYLWKVDRLNSLSNLINHVLSFKLIIPFFLYFLWFIIGIYLLSTLDLWNFNYIKMSILWFVFEGIVILFRIVEYKHSEDLKFQLIKFILNSLSVSTLLVIIMNLYTFNYSIELLLVLIIFCTGVSVIYIERKNDNTQTLGCLNVFLAFIGLFILVYSLINFAFDFQMDILKEALSEYLLLIIYSIWVIPAVYILRIYALYDNVWKELKIFKYYDKRMKKIMKLYIIKNCHINYAKLEFFYRDKSWKRNNLKSKIEIAEYFDNFNNMYIDSKKWCHRN